MPFSFETLSLPRIMGILNVTEDSFSDGGQFKDPQLAIKHAIHMLDAGADIIDIGAESTRPGSEPVDPKLEWQSIEPVLVGLLAAVPACKVSIDTRKAYVAERSIACGAVMINDVSALDFDPLMADLLKDHAHVELVLMHMQGSPKNMQVSPNYEDAVSEVKQYLISRLQYAIDKGINPERIYLDPGIGFGKNLQHNLEILAHLEAYNGHKLLLGASRKSFIAKISGSDPSSRLGGSIASTAWALMCNASIIRVHDVFEHKQFMQVFKAIADSRERNS